MQFNASKSASILSHLLVPGMIGVTLGACTTSNGTSASGGNADSLLPRVLWCGWKKPNEPGWTYEKKFCMRTGVCGAPPAQMCAYNIDGTEDSWKKYTEDGPDGEGFAQWDGFCDETCPDSVEPGKLPLPSCEDDKAYDKNVYGACTPQDPSTGGDPTTGSEPTTGSDPTTGGEGSSATDTDGPNIEIWVCSRVAHDNCQVRSGEGINADDEHCWSTSADTASCVFAASLEEAEAGCNCLCSITDEVFSDACNTPGTCTVVSGLDCEAPYPDSPTPLALTNMLCNGKPMIAASAAAMCPNNYQLFDASATLALADGTSTAITNVVGYLSYTVENCADDACDLTVSVLEIPTLDLSGVYFQGTTVAGSYAFDDLAVRMKGTLVGTWTPSRETVTFGGDPFWAAATMSALSVDSFALPAEPITFGTNQIVGNLTPAELEFTLNFSFPVPGGRASLSLSTR